MTREEATLVNRRRVSIVGIVATSLITLMVIALIVLGNGGVNGMSGASANDVAGAKPTPSATPAQEKACADTWAIVPSDNTNNRWFFEGIASIRDAKTNEEATAAAFDWQTKVRTDPKLLAGAAKVILQRDVDRNTLVDSKNCATEAAVDLDMEIGMQLASSKITPDDVDPNAYNTGVQDGTVIGDTSPGIGGDTSAVQVTLADGRVIWIMARCGNLATQGPPSLPPGVTDNPERCAYNPQLPPGSKDCVPPPAPVCPPETPHGTWPLCKDDSSAGPGPSGNAPIGSGPSEDSGPGEYVPPAEMEQPPAAPYTPPAPPAPAPPATGPAPVPDPAPAPAPEPAAPAPSNPVEGCVIPPGKTSC